LLDRDLLELFEQRLRAQGALIIENWAPGLADEQIDALLQPLGIDLPEEARVWWRWHDGILKDAPHPTEISPGRAHLPLRYVAERYAALADEMSELDDIDALLAPVTEKPALYFHCAVPRDAPVPVYSQNDDVVAPRLVLPSIGELIVGWIELIDRGVWRTNPDGTWAWDHEQLPDDVLERGIY
jgi:hypothetical protein